jgi:hypothetical protein
MGDGTGYSFAFSKRASSTTTDLMTLTDGGNLGLGVTPSAWNSGHTAMQIAFSGAIHGNDSSNNLFVNSNAYFDSVGAFRYIQTGFASSYEQNSGQHRWYTAASGTAGNTISFTQAMTLTAASNLQLGGTANRGTTVGTNALQIFNGTAPAGTLTNGVSLYSSSGDLFFMDAAGTASRVGFRGVPQSGSAKTGSYTLATTDVGDYIEVGSGGSITIPDATFATGDVVSIFNNTSGNITITCTITTAYIAGTDSDKATMTLATRGVATVLFISSTICVVTGNVS